MILGLSFEIQNLTNIFRRFSTEMIYLCWSAILNFFGFRHCKQNDFEAPIVETKNLHIK